MSETEHPLDRAARESIDPRRPDRPRDEAGRFASKDVELETGRQAETHEAGFRTLLDHRLETEGPDPDERTYNSNNPADLERAHRDRQARRRDGGLETVGNRIVTSAEAEEERRRQFIKSHSDPLPKPSELPPDVALSKAEAAERYGQVKQAQRAEAEAQATIAEAEQIAKDTGAPLWKSPGEQVQQPAQGQHVDVQETIRQATALWETDPASAYSLLKAADATAADPNSPAEARAAYSYTRQAVQALEQANPWLLEPSAQVDPEAAKASAQLKGALQNPAVRAELEQRFAAAEQSRQQYLTWCCTQRYLNSPNCEI
jgi:hypothetical protein